MTEGYDVLHHSRQARRAKKIMFALRGRICHLCGHDGATEADLVIPRSVAPRQAIYPDAYRPAHGVNGGGCSTCGRACNQERGVKEIDMIWSPKLEW